MLLASKYEEVSVPAVHDLILISDQAYTRDEILDMQERLIVNTLQFNMSVPTPYVFMRRFLKAADSDKKLLPQEQEGELQGCSRWRILTTRRLRSGQLWTDEWTPASLLHVLS